MRALYRLVTLISLVALAAVPAAADHGDIHPTLREERNWFHCAGATKVQNVSVAQGQIPSWNTTPPSQSVQQGAGCGYYDNLLTGANSPVDAHWQGTFAGNLDRITFDLHRLGESPGATFPDRVVATLTVDGGVLYAGDVDLFEIPSSTGASHSMLLTFDRLRFLTEDGDGEQVRTVRLTIASYNETQSVWVFDTTDVPAGATFNPPTKQGTVINV